MNKLVIALSIASLVLALSACNAGNSTADPPKPSGNSTNANATGSNLRKIAINGKEVMLVDTPAAISSLLKGLTSGKGKDFKLDRAQIPEADLKVLDQYSAQAMGIAECKITSVEGCNSCCADGISSSLRHTTCGDFCDKVCGSEPCH